MGTSPRLLCMLLVAGCGFDPSGAGGSGDGDGGAAAIDGSPGDTDGGGGGDGDAGSGAFFKTITVAARTAELVDFPLYIELTDADLADHATATGEDIHFTIAGGATLDHEVQRWVPASGHLEAWVRVTLADDADTVIQLRYGDAAAAPAPAPEEVWSAGFAAVWHLEESPAAGTMADALGVRPGTPGGAMTADDSVDAALGRGVALDGDDDVIDFSNPLTGGSSHTFSAWVQQDTTGDNDALIVLGDGECDNARWLHTRFDSGTVATGFYCDDWTDTGTDVQGDGWTLLHWTYTDAGESRLYRDGVQVGDPHDHDGDEDTTGAAGRIGNAPAAFGGNMGLNGTVDEVRIATVTRSAAWIATEFANQSNPTASYAVGPETPLP